MIVVADTGPLNYLVLVAQSDLLTTLFGGVSIPIAVRDELADPMAPAAVQTWIARPPCWLSIAPTPAGADAALAHLDAGEQAAIALAVETGADLLLMDDRMGVSAARARGIEVTGTLGILDRAAQRGLIDLPTTMAALRATSFHVRTELLTALLARHKART